MNEQPIDPERLAALLDGTLDPRERDALLAQLALSDDDLDAMADAAAMLRDIESEDAVANAVENADGNPVEHAGAGADVLVLASPDRAPAPARPAARVPAIPRRRWMLGAALAATLTLVVFGSWAWSRARLETDGGAYPAQLVALAAAPDGAPAYGLLTPERIGWSNTRGAPDALTDAARAVRVGARLVALQLAVGAGPADAAPIANDVARLLSDLPAAGPAVAMYRDIAARDGAAEDQRRRLADAWVATLRLVDEDRARLGAWLAAARVATEQGRVEFFRTAASRSAADRLARAAAGLPPAARPAAERVRAAVAGDATIDPAALGRDVTELLAALGS